MKHRPYRDGPHGIIRVVEGFLSDTVAVEKIHRAALGEHYQDLQNEKVCLASQQASYRVNRNVATVLRCDPRHDPVRLPARLAFLFMRNPAPYRRVRRAAYDA